MWWKHFKTLKNISNKVQTLKNPLSRRSLYSCTYRRGTVLFLSRNGEQTLNEFTKCYGTTYPQIGKDILRDNILSSSRKPIKLEELSYVEFLFPWLDLHSSRIALTDGTTGRNVTYKQLKEQIIRCASALRRRGYNKADNIAIVSPNNLDYVTLVIAAAACGIQFTTLNPLSPPLELARQFDLADSTIYVTIPELQKNVEDAIDVSTTRKKLKKEIIVFGNANKCQPFSSLLDDDGSLFPWNQDIKPRDDTLQILFSSGTTGLPKAVELTHYALLSNVACMSEALLEGLVKEGETVSFGVMPFFHLYGQLVLIPIFLRLGVRTIVRSRFEPELFIKDMLQYQTDLVTIVPPLAVFLGKTSLLDNKDLSFVNSMISGAAPLKAEVTEQVLHRFGKANISQAYGMTETGVCVIDTNVPCKHGTSGTLMANTKAKIVGSETGEILGSGETGEIYLQTPFNMKGYKNNPEETKEVLVGDGWARTGDIGVFDSDGYISVTDRKKDMICYKGHKVSPAELESVLLAHPLISDAAVIGVADKDAGELPKAFVVKRDGRQICEEEIQAHMKSYVSPVAYLRGGVKFVDEIPKTASGKILRRALMDGM